MDELIGTIKLFAGNFAPQYYMYCTGQLLSISQNSALFSILGTTYGGDGITTFSLPDLRTHIPVAITVSDQFNANAPNLSINSVSIKPSGANTAQKNMQPYVDLNYIICTQGIYPSRP